MKNILLALCLFCAPVAIGATLIVKDKGEFLVITPDCDITEELTKVRITRLAVGAKIILYTKNGRHSCYIRSVEPYST